MIRLKMRLAFEARDFPKVKLYFCENSFILKGFGKQRYASALHFFLTFFFYM